jgi:succinate dehydrogenase/fumarate reductase cytochrome b subunit
MNDLSQILDWVKQLSAMAITGIVLVVVCLIVIGVRVGLWALGILNEVSQLPDTRLPASQSEAVHHQSNQLTPSVKPTIASQG